MDDDSDGGDRVKLDQRDGDRERQRETERGKEEEKDRILRPHIGGQTQKDLLCSVETNRSHMCETQGPTRQWTRKSNLCSTSCRDFSSAVTR